jgi:ring-1,2-phenylacetyl-CoA epoxidase subunit PaaA
VQKKMVQESVNRWWWPVLMMFGPSDKESPNSEELMRWRVKLHSNDSLRQRFVNGSVAQAKAVELTLPDPELRYNEETGNWDFGSIDWDEFWQVVKGHGPCNRDRMGMFHKKHKEGRWVREAAHAYASRHPVN